MSFSDRNDTIILSSKEMTRWYILLLTAFTAVIAARSFLLESLWLDETVSIWITSGSFSAAWERSIQFQGQSPLYYSILWWVRQVLGDAVPLEFAARLPSLVFFLGAIYFLYKFVRELTDADTAWISVLFFLSLDPAIRSLSARPYGLTIFCTLLSFWAFQNWLKRSHGGAFLVFILATILSYYGHYLFAACGLVHLLLIWYYRALPSKLWPILVGGAVIMLAWTPGIQQLITLNARSESLLFSKVPTIKDLFFAALPPYALVYIAMALSLALLVRRGTFLSRYDLRLTSMLAIWAIVPSLLFFAYSHMGRSGALFQDRYFLWQYPAFAILLALAITSITPRSARVFAILVVFGFAGFREIGRTWQIEDWRSASRLIDYQQDQSLVPVLFFSGLVESNQPEWHSANPMRDYLVSPLAAYPVKNSEQIVLIGPTLLEHEEVQSVLTSSQHFLLVGLKIGDGIPPLNLRPQMEKFRELGFKPQDLQRGPVIVQEWKRP